jgi:two-component system sensor histidine kinase ResE
VSEDPLAIAREELRRREVEQSQFVADVSHELRTPLTILRGVIEVALDGDRSADEYRQVLSEALVEVQHLSRISENLLFLARGTSGQVTLSLARVDLSRFVGTTRAEFMAQAAAKGLALDFAPASDPLPVLADVNRLKQVFHNLLENAIRYTERGRIVLSLRRHDGRAEVSVADTGVGIEESDMPFIFERFFRSDRARRAYRGGSGLGLSIVRWIVEAHKGQVQAESHVGRGTTFRVSFPLLE